MSPGGVARPGAAQARGVRTRGPLDARVRVPGSRSIANRALVCAALAGGTSRLLGVDESDDTAAMREGLRALGVGIDLGSGAWSVSGCAGRLPARGAQLDAHASGTTARFLTGAATLGAA